eukprot:4444843-Pleurochrysis_carterae.AAC.2
MASTRSRTESRGAPTRGCDTRDKRGQRRGGGRKRRWGGGGDGVEVFSVGRLGSLGATNLVWRKAPGQVRTRRLSGHVERTAGPGQYAGQRRRRALPLRA